MQIQDPHFPENQPASPENLPTTSTAHTSTSDNEAATPENTQLPLTPTLEKEQTTSAENQPSTDSD